MMLNLYWDDEQGVGFIDPDDADALVESSDIATLDFLKDGLEELTELYNRCLGIFNTLDKPGPQA